MTEQGSRSRARTTAGAAGGKKTTAAAKKPAASSVKSAAGSAKPASATKATGGGSKSASGAGAKSATVRFTGDWREDVVGEVRAGTKLRVEYAPDRMPGNGRGGVIAEVMFSPGGQHHTGRISGGKFDITVPDDAREMTIWFHRTEGGSTSWDSRFGANYTFPVQQGAAKAANRRPASAA